MSARTAKIAVKIFLLPRKESLLQQATQCDRECKLTINRNSQYPSQTDRNPWTYSTEIFWCVTTPSLGPREGIFLVRFPEAIFSRWNGSCCFHGLIELMPNPNGHWFNVVPSGLHSKGHLDVDNEIWFNFLPSQLLSAVNVTWRVIVNSSKQQCRIRLMNQEQTFSPQWNCITMAKQSSHQQAQ